ncbi:MAG: glycosyltransferase family 9 protein [Rhodospirillales bacterium]
MESTAAPLPVIVYRRGSIGDGIVSLPVLREVRRRHAGARIILLSNRPVAEVAAPMRDLLAGENLVDDDIEYPPGGLGAAAAWALARRIRESGADRMYYLSEPSGIAQALRDGIFFRLLCGLAVTGLPLAADSRRYRRLDDGLWESESARLARVCGFVLSGSAAMPGINPSAGERVAMRDILAAEGVTGRFIAFAPAGKTADKDWGDDRWRKVLGRLSQAVSDAGLVLIGAAADKDRLAALAGDWTGPVANLCGRASPRDSATAMQGAILFLGVDSGPMHLAAAVGVPCVAVFAARARPGVWFPAGTGHRIHYPLDLAESIPDRPGAWDGGESIRRIDVETVAASALDLLAGAARR